MVWSVPSSPPSGAGRVSLLTPSLCLCCFTACVAGLQGTDKAYLAFTNSKDGKGKPAEAVVEAQ